MIDCFEVIAKSRYSERDFSSAVISDKILSKILELTIMAPSSFNLQPYKIIIIKSHDIKKMISSSLLGNNKNKVLKAPVTAIFIADKCKTLIIINLLFII
jgi:nitroreductase